MAGSADESKKGNSFRPNLFLIGSTAFTSLATPLILPRHLLPLVPFPSSLVLFLWCYDEYYSLSSWLDPSVKIEETPEKLGAWYTAWSLSKATLPSVVGLAPSVSATARLLFISRAEIGKWWWWAYLAGGALMVAHMPAGGRAFPLLASIRDGGKEATAALKKWTGMHVQRTFSVDLAAMACFAVATVGWANEYIKW